MEWNEIRSQADADKLLHIVEYFHDWYIAGFRYDPLARAAADDKFLSCCVDDTEVLSVTLRYDSVDKHGNCPEVELQFSTVVEQHFDSFENTCPFSECWIEKTSIGWAFVSGERPISAEERHPDRIEANFYVIAGEFRWRMMGGTFWTLEEVEPTC